MGSQALSPAFGDPEYTGASEHEAAAGQSQQLVTDANDPSLTSEQIDVDTTQDAFAIPPPPPDGKWRAKLKMVDIKDADGQMKHFRTARFENMNDGKPFFVVNLEASLIDLSGRNDGVKTTQYWVKSAVDKRKNVDEMSTITKAAGGVPVARGSHRDRLDSLMKTLAGEPEVILDTFWEASCQACQEKAKKAGEKAPKPFLLGMHRFPQSRAGQADPVVQCPNCKGMCRAQMRIAQFLSVKDVKATRGTA